MEVVETGLVKRLFLRFQDHFGPISGSIADSLTRILRYSIILCKPMFMAIIKPKTDRKTKKYLDTIYTKAIGPSRQFIDFICKFYRTLADSPDSRYFGWTLGALLEIAPLSFDATLFVRSLPVALTIISSLDHFETDFLIMWSLDHVRDGMVEWDHQKDIIMGRGKLMLFDLKSEGIADITIQRSHTTSQTVYGTTMLRECRSVTSLLGGNV
ncbi:hypothetical protein BLNAU_13678 [Blattamonas nauphoetae]|uniref:Uncharacterized protein n=1 Tax=Blattamonas nauphoetae TaxID=2049346 RepID=A0ABQ9XFZ8_9EUKA|nr:hypothetical protein BLNAU_13678 [Blattamonas nauphoetae]